MGIGTADSQKALTSLVNEDLTATATGSKALTSLAGIGPTATANSQKALTSLAAAQVDILPRFARSDRAT